MSELTCKAVISQVRMPVTEEATSQSAVTNRHHDEVLHPMRTAVGLLAQGRDMRIVGHSHRQSQSVAQHRCQWYHALPWHVRRVLYTARHRTGARHAHADGAHRLVAAVLLDQHHHLVAQHLHIVVDIRIISGDKPILSHNFSPDIHHREGSP